MAYIGWANNVNKNILNSTSITVGEGSVITDTAEQGGNKRSRLVCANPSDKYQVTMSFDCVRKGYNHNGENVGDNYTELERFWRWYKFSHKYGVNPFEFPAILINSNRSEGMSTEEREYLAARKNNEEPNASPKYNPNNVAQREYYKIVSAVNGSQVGNEVQVTMQWETYATNVITIPAETAEVNKIIAENGYVDIYFTVPPTTEPVAANFPLLIKKDSDAEQQVYTTLSYYDGDRVFRVYFNPYRTKTAKGTYKVMLKNNKSISSSFIFDIEKLVARNGSVDIILASNTTTQPGISGFELKLVSNGTETTLSTPTVYFDGYKKLTAYFTPLTKAGTYTIKTSFGKTSTFKVS